MTTFYKQSCPLCDADAEYCWFDYQNRKFFECPNCTYFQISKRAEAVLADLSNDRKASYAAQAQQPPAEHILVIRIPDHEHRIATNDVLQVAFVPKAEFLPNRE